MNKRNSSKMMVCKKGHEQVRQVGQTIHDDVHDSAPGPQFHCLGAREEISGEFRERDDEVLAGVLQST